MEETELEMDMEELSSAEDFLEYFEIDYDQKVVHVNRLHILQRFHDYLSQHGELPEEEAAQHALYTEMLTKAYGDFVNSDAKTEKVLKVYKMQGPQTTFVNLGDLEL